jgi:hypothetical protein
MLSNFETIVDQVIELYSPHFKHTRLYTDQFSFSLLPWDFSSPFLLERNDREKTNLNPSFTQTRHISSFQ